MTDRYAVLGNPIAHSKSPLIHAAFSSQTGQDIHYERILVPLDGFEATVRELITQGYRGVNVTVPFKFEAFRLADETTLRAGDAGAVNTLIFNQTNVVGDNTDGAGLVRDIEVNLNRPIQAQRVLLLGAGGAAEGVLHPLLERKPSLLVIANRTLEKAGTMIAKRPTSDTELAGCAFNDLSGQQFDIVINATSAGLTNAALPIPPTVYAADGLAYDMMYGHDTPFMQQARETGAWAVDGLGMLVEQAAEAFYVWRGVRPETIPVMTMVRSLLTC